jgi:hypothetical protein
MKKRRCLWPKCQRPVITFPSGVLFSVCQDHLDHIRALPKT